MTIADGLYRDLKKLFLMLSEFYLKQIIVLFRVAGVEAISGRNITRSSRW